MRRRLDRDPDPNPRVDRYRCRVAIVHRGGELCGHLYLEPDVWAVGRRTRWWRRTEWSEPQEAMRALWDLDGRFAGDDWIGPDELDDVLPNWDVDVDWRNGEQFYLEWQDRETSERLHAEMPRPPMSPRDRRRVVKSLIGMHHRRDFPRRLRDEDVAGVDLVMLDADIAGLAAGWIGERGLSPDRTAVLERRWEETVRVLPWLDRPAEIIYVRGLQELALLVLTAEQHNS